MLNWLCLGGINLKKRYLTAAGRAFVIRRKGVTLPSKIYDVDLALCDRDTVVQTLKCAAIQHAIQQLNRQISCICNYRSKPLQPLQIKGFCR